MKISRNNYESFFVDYLEGNLDEKLVDDFIEFITQNPDLKEELALFEPIAIDTLNVEFGKKELLYKARFDIESEFTEATIANLEGDLTANEKIEFDNYITSHPERKPDLELFEKTRLIADQSVVFQKKNTLYKTTPIKTFLLWSGRVAAVLVLAMLGYFFTGNKEKTPVVNNTITVIENNKPTKEVPVETIKVTENNNIQQNTNQVSTIPMAAGNEANRPKSKPLKNESLRENNTGSINENNMALPGIETIQLARLDRVPATIVTELPEAELATMYITIPSVETPDEYLIVDRIKDKTGFEKINFKKITQAGLNLFANLSNEKFSYQTNETGKVTEIIYDSRLLAFTIPTKTAEKTGE